MTVTTPSDHGPHLIGAEIQGKAVLFQQKDLKVFLIGRGSRFHHVLRQIALRKLLSRKLAEQCQRLVRPAEEILKPHLPAVRARVVAAAQRQASVGSAEVLIVLPEYARHLVVAGNHAFQIHFVRVFGRVGIVGMEREHLFPLFGGHAAEGGHGAAHRVVGGVVRPCQTEALPGGADADGRRFFGVGRYGALRGAGGVRAQRHGQGNDQREQFHDSSERGARRSGCAASTPRMTSEKRGQSGS